MVNADPPDTLAAANGLILAYAPKPPPPPNADVDGGASVVVGATVSPMLPVCAATAVDLANADGRAAAAANGFVLAYAPKPPMDDVVGAGAASEALTTTSSASQFSDVSWNSAGRFFDILSWTIESKANSKRASKELLFTGIIALSDLPLNIHDR